MKTTLRKALPLLLCLIFCICLAPAAWAEETEEIFIIEDYEPYPAADDSVTFAFELSDTEVFNAAGDIVTINFDANGGTGTMASQDFVRGDAAKPLNPNTFTRDGYFFLGWNELADGTAGGGRIIKNGAEMRLSEASSASTLTLYAQWEERTTESDTVSVSFDANGGTGTMPPQDYVRGDVVKPLYSNTFTRDGYIFANWNTEADGSGTVYQNGAKIAPADNMTLYAQWTDTVLVHYDPNGASGTRKAQWFTLGIPKKLGSIEAVGYVMDGYEFVGWAPVPDAAPDDPRIIPSGSEFTVESETWIYAIWKKVPGIAIDKTNFPDDTFRSYVSANLDQNGDGELSEFDIAAVTQINVSGSYNEPGTIQSLEGIRYFTRLQRLYCSYNRLAGLDVSQNTALTYLQCSGNQLTSLDVSNNAALTGLQCIRNQLTSLDISNNSALISLQCDTNQLASLDVSNNTALTTLACSSNQLTNLDVSSNTALTNLYCNNNHLTGLDVSNNTALTSLYCTSNRLASLVLSNNTALTSLQCSNNQLKNLDISQNTALTGLYCDNNQLTNLNVRQNTALKTLSCFSNQLASLDISACPHLVELVESTQPTATSNYIMFNGNTGRLSFDLSTALTPALSFGAGIAIDENAFPDPAFREYVNTFDLDENGELADAECKAVTQINVAGSYNNPNLITSLEGIELFPALTTLQCGYNQLTSLDISANTALTSLNCYGNQLTSLDLSSNTALTFLQCFNNHLTSLDISANTALTSLNCYGNQLTSLDISANTALTSLSCYGNQLSELDVSQCPILADLVVNTLPSVQTYSTGTTDTQPSEAKVVTFSSSDSYRYSLLFDRGVNLTPAIDFGSGIVFDSTMFPDPVFLDYVQDFDIDCNGVLSDTEINQVFTINVHGKGITSLQGIELFPNLTDLYCADNQLTSLDLSDNTALTKLSCNNNRLTSLDISSNTALTGLYCDNNQLTNLDLSCNTALIFLRCANNQLTNLDLSQNTALMGLSCEGNRLTVLDLSNFPFLSLAYNTFEPQYTGNTAEYHFKDYGTGNGPRSDSVLLVFDTSTSIITAPGLVLPAALTEIGEEAFADGAFRYAIVPDSVTVIGPRAFADCQNLAAVYIPASITEIAPDAFSGISDLIVVGTADGAAHSLAQQNRFYYVEYYLR